MSIRAAFFLTALVILFTLPAYAYIDPGSGALIVQMLFAGVAGLLGIMKLYWTHIKVFFRKLSGKPVEIPTTESPKDAE